MPRWEKKQITWNGRQWTFAEAAQYLGLNPNTIAKRKQTYDWSDDQIMTHPAGVKRHVDKHGFARRLPRADMTDEELIEERRQVVRALAMPWRRPA